MKKLGIRVKEFRERLGIRQEELARLLGVARPTISQMENGERKISAEELSKLSKIFNVSSDILLGLKKEPEMVLRESTRTYKAKPEIRINVPRPDVEKFKETLLYILNKVGSKPNIGETVLYKLLYFIDFNFYERYEEQLIGATYIKNHYGPTPIEFKKIADRMIKNKEIVKVESQYFKYPQTKYLPLKKADLSKFRGHEKDMIDDVLDSKLSDMNATEIKEYSHQDVPWLTTEDGESIEYESVFYRTPAYSVRQHEEDIP
jgi:transcriptional regulator with XRE-family HTH domain